MSTTIKAGDLVVIKNSQGSVIIAEGVAYEDTHPILFRVRCSTMPSGFLRVLKDTYKSTYNITVLE
ncbi:hypothetical protein [Pseudoalteromonas phage vB_PtuP_Slicky01]|nr:hypothetical protein [Pseudoalteromonas phage vB_PtuP_Slicky01]